MVSLSRRTGKAPVPPDGYRAVGPDEWRAVWRRVRVSASVKAIGYTLAEVADWKTGGSIFLGNRKIALAAGEQSTRSVIRALAQMRELGLVWRYSEGGSRGGLPGSADEYMLTIPVDLAVRVPMLTPRLDLPDAHHVTSGHQVPEDHQVTMSQGPCDSGDANHVTMSHPTSTTISPVTSTADAPRLAEDQNQDQGQNQVGGGADDGQHPARSRTRSSISVAKSQNRRLPDGPETIAEDAQQWPDHRAESPAADRYARGRGLRRIAG